MNGLSLAERLVGRMSDLTVKHIGDTVRQNAQHNAAMARNGRSILDLSAEPIAEGDSALVIAAGPSLHRQDTAGLLKSSGYRGRLIVTESSMSWCLRNGIVPDLVVTLDPHPKRIVRWFGDPELNEEALASDDYFARQDMDPAFRRNQLQANQELIDLIDRYAPQMRIAVSSSASPAVTRRIEQAGFETYWWNPFMDDHDGAESLTRKLYELNGKPCINAGGNVGAACWVLAHTVLGKSVVGITGMDFSYYADTPYRQTQYYTELCEILGPDRIDEAYVHIDNPYTGTQFYTDPAYYWYRTIFLEMAQAAAEDGVITYNCSGGGILFGEGITWIDAATFLSGQLASSTSDQSRTA